MALPESWETFKKKFHQNPTDRFWVKSVRTHVQKIVYIIVYIPTKPKASGRPGENVLRYDCINMCMRTPFDTINIILHTHTHTYIYSRTRLHRSQNKVFFLFRIVFEETLCCYSAANMKETVRRYNTHVTYIRAHVRVYYI